MIHNPSVPQPWDHKQIVARANARAQSQFGKAASGVFTDNDLPVDIIALRKASGPNGPTIGKLERAAKALKWTLPQLLGIDDPDYGLNPSILYTALSLIRAAAGDFTPPPGEDAADYLTRSIEGAYRVVLDVEREEPGSSSSPSVFMALTSAFREMLGKLGNPRETS